MDNVKKEAEKTWEGGNNYIIFDDNASTKEELDKNWAEFVGNMTVKHQLRADEESIRLYGKTNQERYNEKLKKISKTDTAVKEYGVIIEPDDSMDNIERAEKIHKKFDEETLKKIEDTKEYMDAMNTVLMYPTETLAELEDLWEKIQSEVPVENMILNNTFSMQTWGMTSEELYNSEKASFLDMAEDVEQDLNDWDIAKKIMDINDGELPEDSDVDGMVESLYMLSSVEPSSFFEKVNVAMEKEKIAKSLHNIIEYCPMAGMNPVVGMAGRPLPAVLPDEVEREGINTDANLNKYKVVPTNAKKAKKYKDYFDYLYRGIMPEDFEEVYEEWKADVYTEQSIYNRTHSDISKQNLFALGWPYNIPFENEASCHEFTMQRISEYYQYAGSKVINLTEFTKMNSDVVKPNVDDSPKKKNMNPIYLLLISGTKESLTSSAIRWWTKGPFCHAAIGFRHTLDDLKSFNTTKYNGLSDESLDFYTPDERIAVYGLFVDDPTMEALRANLDFYIDNRDKTKYSRLNILSLAANIPLNFQFDMVCSQFVDRILKFAKIDITHKDSSLVSPNDFYTSAKNNKKMYKLYDGKIKDYKPNKVKATVQRLLGSKNTKRINEALMLDNISEASATYDPPYNRQQILDIYGQETLDRLMEDPAHRFRADTGIELMHIEPSKKEFIRIWKNWNLMTAEQKKISDKECKKLYGKTNLKFYYDNLPLYRKDGTYHEFPAFFEAVLNEDSLSTKERNELPASAFGIPSMRKYPLTDASHVKSAIKLFGHCPKAHEKELASNIKSAMHKYDIPFDSVGKDNKLYKYIHEAYDQILDSISAELVVETKEFPVQFNKDGDLIIKNYRKLDYNAEYQTAHSALLTYKKAKNYEGMKYELSKLWFINTILLSKAHDPKTTEEERIEINKIRAWVMNDINTYLKILNKIEPKFNFSEYYNESPFSDVAIKINHSTIKAFGDIIKHVIH